MIVGTSLMRQTAEKWVVFGSKWVFDMFAHRWKWVIDVVYVIFAQANKKCLHRWKWHQLIRSSLSPLHWQERPPPRFDLFCFSAFDVQWWFAYSGAFLPEIDISAVLTSTINLLPFQKFGKICTDPDQSKFHLHRSEKEWMNLQTIQNKKYFEEKRLTFYQKLNFDYPPFSLCEWYWIVSIGGSNAPWHAIYFLQPPPHSDQPPHASNISPKKYISNHPGHFCTLKIVPGLSVRWPWEHHGYQWGAVCVS